jgi:hypothetical protein
MKQFGGRCQGPHLENQDGGKAEPQNLVKVVDVEACLAQGAYLRVLRRHGVSQALWEKPT